VDATFAPVLNGNVRALAVQADGKIVVGGEFTHANGVSRPSIARLNADGTTDATFNAGSGFESSFGGTSWPEILVIQPDGKILAAGPFSGVNGVPYPSGLARLNADGSRDATFKPELATFTSGPMTLAVALQADGKILIGGTFVAVNGTPRDKIARLNADGSLDTSFSTALLEANAAAGVRVTNIAVQRDGRIVIAGNFERVNGDDRWDVAILNANGSSFENSIWSQTGAVRNPPNPFRTVENMYLGPNDRIYFITRIGSSIQLRVANSDGSIRPGASESAAFAGASAFAALPGADESFIIGGQFNIGGRPNIVRLRENNNIDSSFPNVGTDLAVRALARQQDGKVLLGGDFTSVGGTSGAKLARVSVPAPKRAKYFDFDGDGRDDVSVYRPSNNTWYFIYSSQNRFDLTKFGDPGDLPVPGDYDLDGRTDVAIYRPSNSAWWMREAANGTAKSLGTWGQAGDIPSRFDRTHEGNAIPVVYRPSQGVHYLLFGGSQGSFTYHTPTGTAGDQPVAGDFDGDDAPDAAVFRPSTGEWVIASSDAYRNVRMFNWGTAGDIAVAGDYDGDRRTEVAVWRPSDGNWYIGNTATGLVQVHTWGVATDRPVPADYDGDNITDVAVFRPSNGTWYIKGSLLGFYTVQFGAEGDIPLPSAFIR
jgi:uncharacterized delta-60 repeat protein